MAESISIFDPTSGRALNAVIEIFDPPMCCPTGLCGPSLDQTLLDVSEMVLALQAAGARVDRYQMSGNPNAFLKNSEVMELIRAREMAALPITLVRGQLLKAGAYPTLTEIRAALNGDQA